MCIEDRIKEVIARVTERRQQQRRQREKEEMRTGGFACAEKSVQKGVLQLRDRFATGSHRKRSVSVQPISPSSLSSHMTGTSSSMSHTSAVASAIFGMELEESYSSTHSSSGPLEEAEEEEIEMDAFDTTGYRGVDDVMSDRGSELETGDVTMIERDAGREDLKSPRF